jgi:hypothetical protein
VALVVLDIVIRLLDLSGAGFLPPIHGPWYQAVAQSTAAGSSLSFLERQRCAESGAHNHQEGTSIPRPRRKSTDLQAKAGATGVDPWFYTSAGSSSGSADRGTFIASMGAIPEPSVGRV